MLGCGDDPVIATTAAETMMTTSATSTSTSTGTDTNATESTASATSTETSETSTSTSTTSSGETSTGTSTTGITSTGTTSATDSDTDSGTTSDTDGPEDAEYAARFFPGGLDRVFIRKAEKISELCTEIVVVWPAADEEPYTITSPEGWGIDRAVIAEGLAGCLEFGPLDPPTVAASTGTGAISWPDQGICPPTLSINVTLGFTAGDLLWVPTKDQLSALDLPVENCP